MFIQGFGKAFKGGAQAFLKCRVQAEWCLWALHRHSTKPECTVWQRVLGIPWSQAAKSRDEWEARPRISSLNAQGIWHPASLPAGMCLRAHLTWQVSDTQRKPHTVALAAPCRIANSLGRVLACAECPSARPVLPCHHCTMRWNPCPDSSLAK